jgi:hypothetical protein
MKLVFFDRFSKNTWILNFMKIRPVAAELFPADEHSDNRTGGWANLTKIIVVFRNFAKSD